MQKEFKKPLQAYEAREIRLKLKSFRQCRTWVSSLLSARLDMGTASFKIPLNPPKDKEN